MKAVVGGMTMALGERHQAMRDAYHRIVERVLVENHATLDAYGFYSFTSSDDDTLIMHGCGRCHGCASGNMLSDMSVACNVPH